MRLFFIRHAESVNNVANQHTGSVDSPLTAHGVVQAHRLAARLAQDTVISHVFSSPLTCSLRTAEAISDARNKAHGGNLTAIQLSELQGPELIMRPKLTDAHSSRAEDQSYIDNTDWMHEMRRKADCFVNNYLIPLLCCDDEDEMACAIVTQGDELNVVAKAFFDRIPRGDIVLPLDPERQGLTIDSSQVIFPPWALTGILDVIISPGKEPAAVQQQQPPKLPFQADIKRVNCRCHLDNLQKARGGIGSAPFDEKQRTIHNFFTPLPRAPGSDDIND